MTRATPIRIPDLPAASGLAAGDLLLVYQGGQTRKVDASLILSPAPAASPAVAVTVTAGTALSGHKAVVMGSAGAIYADAATPAHRGRVLGITTGAPLLAAPVVMPSTRPRWSGVAASA